MPPEARWFVKAGLCYLALTFIVGSVLLALEAFRSPAPYVLGVEHAHLGLVGWLVNTVIGIALWMLPLNRARFPHTQGRYPKGMPAACFASSTVDSCCASAANRGFNSADRPLLRPHCC